MKLLIHDTTGATARRLREQHGPDAEIGPDCEAGACVGCFGCWVKTPGRCVLKDGLQNMGALLAGCDEVVIVSRLQYGSYSPFVRKVWDRSLPFLLPWFELRQGQMHHQSRYKARPRLQVFFYGAANEAARRTAEKLVKANALNFNARAHSVQFGEEADPCVL